MTCGNVCDPDDGHDGGDDDCSVVVVVLLLLLLSTNVRDGGGVGWPGGWLHAQPCARVDLPWRRYLRNTFIASTFCFQAREAPPRPQNTPKRSQPRRATGCPLCRESKNGAVVGWLTCPAGLLIQAAVFLSSVSGRSEWAAGRCASSLAENVRNNPAVHVGSRCPGVCVRACARVCRRARCFFAGQAPNNASKHEKRQAQTRAPNTWPRDNPASTERRRRRRRKKMLHYYVGLNK
jgi:hypothetical protein